jgi:hypothetical protein
MSVSTAPAPPTTARDLRSTWRLLIAIALPIGPLLVTVTRGIMPYWTTDDTPTITAKSLAHPAAMEAMAWLSLVMVPALVISVLAIGYVARRGAPVLATIGAALSFLAYVDWNAAGNSDLLVLTAGKAGIDQETINRIVDASANHPVAAIAGFGWVIGHILGMVLLGVALLRARAIPKWAAVVLMVSQPMHLVSAIILPSRLLDVTAGWGLTTVGFAAVAFAVLRTRDQDWDLPPATR